MSQLNVISVEAGSLKFRGRLPANLKQAATDAYHAASGLFDEFDQSRIDELIACGLRILADSANGTGNIPHLYRASDNEAEKLNDLVNRTKGKKHIPLWKPLLRDSEHVHSSQLIAAYALLQIDRAAKYYLADNLKQAFASLALATIATSDYGFHWGHADRVDLQSSESRHHSKKSGRVVGREAAKLFAIECWHKGPAPGQAWKSKLAFAKTVKAEVMALAKANGFTMKEDNATRTIREWIVEEVRIK